MRLVSIKYRLIESSRRIILSLYLLLCAFLCIHAQSAFSDLAEKYAESGEYSEAIRLQTIALTSIEKFSGRNNQQYAIAVSDLAYYCFLSGLYTEALSHCLESLRIRELLVGTNHIVYANELNNLAEIYAKMSDYSKAIECALKVLDIHKSLNEDEYTEDALTINNLSGYYSKIGDFTRALSYAQDALAIRKVRYGENSSEYAASLINYSLCLYQRGDYKNSIIIGHQLLKTFENLQDQTSLDYIACLQNLSAAHFAIGNFENAIYYGKLALSTKERKFGISHPECAITLYSLSMYYTKSGDYHNALYSGEKAHAIIKETLEEESCEYANSLSNLANRHVDLKDYDKALQLYIEALTIYRIILPESHPDIINSLNNISLAYGYLGNTTQALNYAKLALDCSKELFKDSKRYYISSILNMSLIYAIKGDYKTALNYCKEAEKHINHSEIGYVNILDNMANCYFFIGEIDNAIQSEQQALELQRNFFEDKHPFIINNQIKLAVFYNSFGNYDKLIELIQCIEPNLTYHLNHVFAFCSLADRTRFWNENSFWYKYIMPWFSYSLSEDNYSAINALGYNSVLYSKGLILNTEMEFINFLSEASTPSLLNKFNELKSLHQQLNMLYTQPINQRYISTDSLEACANVLEKELMGESLKFGNYTQRLSINWEEVRSKLNANDIVIEFLASPLPSDSIIYMAYILKSDYEVPHLVRLFEHKDLQQFNNPETYKNTDASQLLWGKLAPYLEGVKDVYFAPDGELHQIAIEYLPDVDGEGLISDRYNIHRLSSTREIVLNNGERAASDAVVYGGIRYKTDVQTMELESKKYEKSSFRGYLPYYNLADTLALRAGIEYLPFTLKETAAVDSLMKINGYASTFVFGNEATEESFKNLSGKKNGIIHISTHGFYWKEDEADKRARSNERLIFMSQFGENARRNVEDKALTRTGLFMAGANNALSGKELPEGMDDGILTAQEIANLDLRGLDLVVLSACQTGMGDISSDGVFGLQRGFKKAGANSILMSLWNVDDEATQILMTEFYKNYLGGMSKRESLLAAQKVVRETPGFEDPEYWAAFILLDALN